MKKIVVAIFLLLPLQATAQDTLLVKPGNQLIDGSFIEEYTNKWKVFVKNKDGDESLMRIWTDYAHILDIQGTSYLHRVQDLYNSDYLLEQTWINVVDLESLAPDRFINQSANGDVDMLFFSDKKVVHRTNRNKEKMFKSDTLQIDAPVYDWNLYGMLLVGLPFEAGNIYKLPVWSQPNQSKAWLTARVVGNEKVKTLDGSKIETVKFGTDRNLTFWLTKEKPYVIQLTLDMPNGSTMIWKMM